MIDAFAPPGSSAAGDSAAEGSSGAAARADHKHAREAADANLSGTPTTSAVGDSASVGVSTTGSRSDHRHGREAFATTSDIADVAATESAGSASTVARGDHVHHDAAFDAWTSYSPSFTNITSGAGSFSYLLVGKTVKIRGNFSAGTATAAAAIRVSLPAGMTNAWAAVLCAQNNNTDIGANIAGSEIRIFDDLAAGNWTAGASIASVHYNGEFEIT